MARNIIAPAFLGTGTANASTFLSGDGTYKGAVSSVTSANTDISFTGTTDRIATFNSAGYIKNQNSGAVQTANITINGQIRSQATVGSYPFMQADNGGIAVVNSASVNALIMGDRIRYENNGFYQSFYSAPTITAQRNIYLPDANGIVALTSDVAAVTGYTISTKSANYTETATSGTIIIKGDTNTAGFTITLPSAVGNKSTIVIKKTAALNTLTINTTLSQTIDDGLTASLTRQYESITLVSDNTNWIII